MRASLIVVVSGLLACAHRALPAEGHVRVFIDTDAPLPHDGTGGSPLDPAALIDTVRIEVVPGADATACDSCIREFALDDRRVDAGASFTVLASEGRAPLLHATAFLASTRRSAVKGAEIELWVRLPEPPAEGGRDVTLRLSMDDFGKPRTTPAQPITIDDGPPVRPRTIWPRALHAPCAGVAPPGAVCIPGGAFWMGSPDDASFEQLVAPRVVALRPFHLDATEVTVAAYRAGGASEPSPPTWSGSLVGTRPTDFCTYTTAPDRFDAYAVSCITWTAARAFCMHRGGDLPTEAQREYAASALVGQPYPWGRDRPACGDAVLATGPHSERFSMTGGVYDTTCRASAPLPPDLGAIGFSQPVDVPHGRDVLTLPGGTVRDLAGGLSEWVRDDWQTRSSACWTSPGVAVDPVCVADPPGLRTLRGASWTSSLVNADAYTRQSFNDDPGISGIGVGFRCAYPGG